MQTHYNQTAEHLKQREETLKLPERKDRLPPKEQRDRQQTFKLRNIVQNTGK